MELTRVERERITDGRLKLQAVADSLNLVDPRKIPRIAEIQDCLDDADESLSGALRSGPDSPAPK